ncbi:MAG: hypothetical protein HQL67_03585 [Magnetococcales bacterium]|nr:hypothetical protein [Magnetococcales bacterium]
MNTKKKLFFTIGLVGGISGLVLGYVINAGVGNDGFDYLHFWALAGVVTALIRAKISPSLKHHLT